MRLLSYNIHKGIGGRDRRYRLERIAEVIAAETPDVIGLQEVDRHAGRTRHDDQPRLLAEMLGLPHALFQLNVTLRRGGGYGNLILSRWPIRAAEQVSLQLRRRRPRGAQLAVIDTPSGPLHLVNWHLGLAERERRWQTTQLLEHPAFTVTARQLPTLIVGDFNDWRNTLAQAVFAAHGFHQWTSPRSRFRSFPAHFPVLALDKAFARGPLIAEHLRIVRNAGTRSASDHLPLVVEFGMGRESSVDAP